jgi:hypothetical protein
VVDELLAGGDLGEDDVTHLAALVARENAARVYGL